MILHGDCLDVMAALDADSVDAIVTDPPYGLGFMGKAWDHGVPGVPFWTEAIRVAKPGAHLVAFGGTRTFHRLTCAIEDAGWEIRDCLSWLYGSGFPKSHNGSWGGTALKPAWEPIILARKPLIGTVAANVQAHGTGALNVDGCRIAGEATTTHSRGNTTAFAKRPGEKSAEESGRVIPQNRSEFIGVEHSGRWPANLILDDEAARLLDEQSGESSRSLSSGPIRRGERTAPIYGGQTNAAGTLGSRIGDFGGASRFFYTAKASRAEREEGLEGVVERTVTRMNHGREGTDDLSVRSASRAANHHPTVKPVALMRWLCRLVTPPGGLILDPFAGSGSTGVAAVLENFRVILIEKDAEYLPIIEGRLAKAREQPSLWSAP